MDTMPRSEHDPLVDYEDSDTVTPNSTPPVDVRTSYRTNDMTDVERNAERPRPSGPSNVGDGGVLCADLVELTERVPASQAHAALQSGPRVTPTAVYSGPDPRVAGDINVPVEPGSVPTGNAGEMVLTRSQSAELQRQQQQQQQEDQHQQQEQEEREPEKNLEENVDNNASDVANPDPRGQIVEIGSRRFPAPITFDDVSQTDFKRISLIPWFDRAAVLTDAENGFGSLEGYAWDGEFFWGVNSEALASRVWQRIIAMDDIDLANYGAMDVKRTRNVADVSKGLQTFAGGPLIDDDVDVDVDLWRYRVYSERPYVANLCSITDEELAAWRGRYMVNADALCYGRAIIMAQFRYVSRADSTYWNSQIRWERRTLSVLGRFVPYHLQCCYNLTEAARDRLLVRIPPAYDRLAVYQGFLFEQEPVFTYKSSRFLDDPETGLWVVAYTELVVRVCAALLLAVYDEYRLWYVPPDVIAFARQLGFAMEVAMGSRANVRKVLELLDVIETTDFSALPESWRARRSRAIDYHPGRTGSGGDYVYYDPWRRQKIDEQSACTHASATRVIPDDLECGWVHPEGDVERTPRDDSCDYHPRYGRPHSRCHSRESCAEQGQPDDGGDAAAGPSSNAPSAAGETAIVRRFLGNAGVLRSDEDPMTLSQMKAYIR